MCALHAPATPRLAYPATHRDSCLTTAALQRAPTICGETPTHANAKVIITQFQMCLHSQDVPSHDLLFAACDSTCTTCEGPEGSDCTTCDDPFFLTSTGNCTTSCPEGTYPSGGGNATVDNVCEGPFVRNSSPILTCVCMWFSCRVLRQLGGCSQLCQRTVPVDHGAVPWSSVVLLRVAVLRR